MAVPQMQKWSSSAGRLGRRGDAVHQGEIGKETDQEADEPGVVVQDAQGRIHQADESDCGAGGQSGYSRPIEAVRIFVLAAALVEILDYQEFLSNDEIIADEHACDGAEKTGVAYEPNENITAIAGEELPRLHDNAHGGGDEAAGAETDAARGKIGEIVCRGDDVGGDVDVERGHEQRNHGEDDGEGITEAREDGDGIPERFAENDESGGGDGDADERIKSHGRGETQRLADQLIAQAPRASPHIATMPPNGRTATDY